MRQLIEDLISAMEYHVEQTRPVHMTTVAIQAAKDALKAMPAQPVPVQEPDNSAFRHRVRVHLANRNFYSHAEFCDKLEALLHEAPPAAPVPRCTTCDGTGDVHDQTGEWRGTCHCAKEAHAAPVQLTERELELIDGMIEVQLRHAEQCDGIANRTMAKKQKGWDMERVALLQKLKEKNNG